MAIIITSNDDGTQKYVKCQACDLTIVVSTPEEMERVLEIHEHKKESI